MNTKNAYSDSDSCARARGWSIMRDSSTTLGRAMDSTDSEPSGKWSKLHISSPSSSPASSSDSLLGASALPARLDLPSPFGAYAISSGRLDRRRKEEEDEAKEAREGGGREGGGGGGRRGGGGEARMGYEKADDKADDRTKEVEEEEEDNYEEDDNDEEDGFVVEEAVEEEEDLGSSRRERRRKMGRGKGGGEMGWKEDGQQQRSDSYSIKESGRKPTKKISSHSSSSNRREKDEPPPPERREKHGKPSLRQRKSRWSKAEEMTPDEDYHKRKEKRWDYDHHSKASRPAERSRDTRNEEDADSYRGRSRSKSPRSHKRQGSRHSRERTRSPSPYHKDRQEKTRNENEKRYKRSGLGGYSPRRRLSESAAKTPSPPTRSPERKKSRAWDLPPVGIDMVTAMAQQQQAAALASVTPFIPVNPVLTATTLTQATRPVRRVYIGNVPSTVSDGELLEFINAAMLSANANYLPGTKPCISCMVNAEKNYAFAEFLTPEDTSAALAFDGITLHGTILKIRRPKDYVPPIKGVVETSTNSLISSVVVDSPRKVFVGNICPYLSADKLKEIVTSFGQLKAYHWEVKIRKGRKEAFAFFEYLDPSVVLKACAGLNGLRLGSRILIAMQAAPDSGPEDEKVEVPLYDIPEDAKPLLEPATRVLELRNVISKEEVLSMTDAELDEIEEDIRLECLRFGTVRSIHMVRPKKAAPSQLLLTEGTEGDPSGQVATGSVLLLTDTSEAMDVSGNEGTCQQKTEGPPLEEVSAEGVAEVFGDVAPNGCPPPGDTQEDSSKSQLANIANQPEEKDGDNNTSNSNNVLAEENLAPLPLPDTTLGIIYVEFSREEFSSQAAHALHGRPFGDKKVSIDYYPLKQYQRRYQKGVYAKSLIEKQALAVAVQEHLKIIEREQPSGNLLTAG